MQKHPFRPLVSSLFVSLLAFSTTGCDLFNEPPPRYNTVAGERRVPILNPGGEGPNTIALHQFEETERYTTKYPTAEDMAAIAEVEGGELPEEEFAEAQMVADEPLPADIAPMPENQMAMTPPPVEPMNAARPETQPEEKGFFGSLFDFGGNEPAPQRKSLNTASEPEVEQAVPVSAVESENMQPPVVTETVKTIPANEWTPSAPLSAAPGNAPAELMPQQQQQNGEYPKLSSVPDMPNDVKARADSTRAEFEEIQKQQAAAEKPVNNNAEKELQAALEAEQSAPPVASYQPEAVSPQQVMTAPLPPEGAAGPAPVAANAPLTPAPLPNPAPIDTASEASPMETASPLPVQPYAPAPVPPQAVEAYTPPPAPSPTVAPAPSGVTTIANFSQPEPVSVPQPAVMTASPSVDVYSGSADGVTSDGLPPISLVPPQQFGGSRGYLPDSRYASRRELQHSRTTAYRQN